jgi:hypothetical protein
MLKVIPFCGDPQSRSWLKRKGKMLYETVVQTRLVPALVTSLQDRALITSPPPLPALYRRYLSIVPLTYELPIRYVGYGRLFEPINGLHHRVYAGKETDWVFLPLDEDPRFHSRFGFRAPRRVIQHLAAIVTAMEKAGVNFDTLWVAHEVPKFEPEATPY